MESNNLTEKLNTFTSLVLKDAEQKREKLLDFSGKIIILLTILFFIILYREYLRRVQ